MWRSWKKRDRKIKTKGVGNEDTCVEEKKRDDNKIKNKKLN